MQVADSVNHALFEVFGVFVAEVATEPHFDVVNGFVSNFVPSEATTKYLSDALGWEYGMRSFASYQEIRSGDHSVYIKQMLDYISTYGFGANNLFDVSYDEDGRTYHFNARAIRAVTLEEARDLIREKMYKNSPVKDGAAFKTLIEGLRVNYDYDLIANNEIRCLVWDGRKIAADDLLRVIVYKATGSALLIKSREVVRAVEQNAHVINLEWLELHVNELAAIFNRFKPFFMAMKKNPELRHIVNVISAKSKKLHKPLKQSAAKTAIADYQAGKFVDFSSMSTRDLFKIIQTCAGRLTNTSGAENISIRNGKMWTIRDRQFSKDHLGGLIDDITHIIANDRLSHLRGKKVCVDSNIDYGLPVSQKQTIGRLPFGTKITTPETLSIGIFWREGGGANDLDLSAVSEDGSRVGWGSYYGDHSTDFMFSGDMTRATPCATEFFTSSGKDYGLFVNNFAGSDGAKFDLIIGERRDKTTLGYESKGADVEAAWVDGVIIREPYLMSSKGMLIGFLKNGVFSVFGGRLTESRANFSQNTTMISCGLSMGQITTNTILKLAGVEFVDAPEGADFDLSYSGMTYETLEKLFDL